MEEPLIWALLGRIKLIGTIQVYASRFLGVAMILNKKSLLAIICGLMTLSIISLVFAADDTKEIVAIEKAIKAQWDKPNNPIRVPVIVNHGDYAIADWIQEPRGGRALLRRDADNWQTIFCGDVLLSKKAHMINAGVPVSDAEYLEFGLAQAELNISAKDMVLVNSFIGIVDLLTEPNHHAH